MTDMIQLAIVREKSGGKIRCMYLGHLRVFGSKPYASENLPHDFYTIKISDVEAAVRFERKHPNTEPPYVFEKPGADPIEDQRGEDE